MRSARISRCPIKPAIAKAGLAQALMLLSAAPALAVLTDTVLVPASYVTTHGKDSGTPVSALDKLDESGLTTDRAKFVQFEAAAAGTTYAGYRTYTLPTSIRANAITRFELRVNYRGPVRQKQQWTWSIFDWNHGAYFPLGDNFFAPPMSPWTILTFHLEGNNLANYVRPNDRQIRIRVISNNTAGNASLDYEALTVTRTSTPTPAGRSFYVSTAGSNANPGTIAKPWRTISKAASTVAPGSTVYVRGGVYHERVVMQVSGSASAGFVQFQSFPGELAIIDGTGVAMPQAVSTPIGLLQITNRSYVSVLGMALRNWKANDQNFFPAGISVTGSGSQIQLTHNQIYSIANPTGACGGQPQNCGAHGLAVYGTSSAASLNNLIIDGNELYNLTLGQSESMALNGNVQSWSVTNNIVHDSNNIGIDAIGFEPTSPNPAVNQARDGYIGGNVVYNINDNNNPAYPPHDNSADGIYVDGGTRITIERNVLHNNNLGLELASEHAGHVTSYVVARSNLIYLNTAPGISIGGFDSSVGSTDHCTIINNTLFQNDSTPNDGSGEFQMQFFPNDGTAANNQVENNIIFANNQGVLINNPFTHPAASLDHNLYYASDPNNVSWIYNNQTYSSLASYRSHTGQDLNSKFANPKFLSAALPDLWVLAGSPAIDAGTALGMAVRGTFDHAGFQRVQGAAIDIGAYEQ